MFGMIASSENGLTRSGPRSISVSQQSAKDFRPPIAVATEAPTRSESFSITIPESNSACRAAATTSCAKRSIRRACLYSIHRVGSNSFASQAKLTGKPLASKALIAPAAERLPIKRSQLVATPLASGVTAPSPVIITLRRPFAPISPPIPSLPSTRSTSRVMTNPVRRRPGGLTPVLAPPRAPAEREPQQSASERGLPAPSRAASAPAPAAGAPARG
jgi:hypothetical protein